MMDRAQVSERLGGRVPVATHPKVLERILEVCDDPGVSIQELAQAIAEDPVSTARLLRNVNSQFTLSESVISIERACQVLGMRRARGLLRKVPTFSGASFETRALVRHSTTTAEVCARMARLLPGLADVEAEHLWVYGLLHDLGQFSMIEGIGAEYLELRKRLEGDPSGLPAAEKEAFGFSHNELGAMLVKRWELPEELVRTTRFHHNERGLAEIFPEVAAVYVADLVAERAGRTAEGRLLREVPRAIADRLGLSKAHLAELLSCASERLTA